MIWVALVDRVGSGLWAATSVLYFTYVARLTVAQIGVLVAASGIIGIAGAPVGGRLADRFPATRVLAGFQFLRAAASLGLLLAADHIALLMICSAMAGFGYRAASVLTRLYASRIAGAERVRYQAVNRTVANAGWALGGLGAAAALAVGTTFAYRSLLLGDALSFVVIALITLRCVEAGPTAGAVPQDAAAAPTAVASPWRDRTYLAYVATETVLFFHDAVFTVGLPLWAIHATEAPHALVPFLLVVNNVLVVGLQMPLARLGATTHAARALLLPLSLMFAVAAAAIATSAAGGAVLASVCLVAAATAFTLAEMVHATVSWELSIALAPDENQGAYLGVHGLAQATQRAAGPMAVTAAISVGPVGWLFFGLAIAGACLVQHRLVRRPLGMDGGPWTDPVGQTAS
ncbi:MFS transporter [Actinoallomurus liliacearum]|uniref:MFS transporter n=1 Tax=Actinoallomurus liliacearum TaxID=1080073 RepID=A0ABP8TRL3_9ACTN